MGNSKRDSVTSFPPGIAQDLRPVTDLERADWQNEGRALKQGLESEGRTSLYSKSKFKLDDS